MKITSENAAEVIGEVRSAPRYPQFNMSQRPIWNICCNFARLYNYTHQPGWLVALEQYDRRDEETALSEVFPTRDYYLNYVILWVILDFEEYVKGALWETGHLADIPIEKQIRRLPRGRSVVEHLFDWLPGRIHPSFGLPAFDSEAYSFFSRFYSEVRNSLFHGGWIQDPQVHDFLCFVEWYKRGFEWIASWRTTSFFLEREDHALRPKTRPIDPTSWIRRKKEFRTRRSEVSG